MLAGKLSIVLVAFFVSQIAVGAEPVEVTLEAPPAILERVQFVQFGATLSGGRVATLTFSREDIANGLRSKLISVEPSDIGRTCSYQWMLMVEPQLLRPLKYDPNGLKFDCKIEGSKIPLTQPYDIQNLEIRVGKAAFDSRQAKVLLATIRPI